MTIQEFQRLTEDGILLLDGATGSNLRKAGMPVGVCSEQWVLEHPDVLIKLQKGYVEAGSQVIYAPTFMANRIGLSMFGLEKDLEKMNRELVALSRQAAEGKAYVAGDVTTTGKVLGEGKDITYHELFEVYKEQIRVLADAGVDLLTAETMLTIEETLVVLDAAQAVCSLPVLCSLTVQADGSLIYGGTVTEMAESLQTMGAAAVGLNCSVGPDQLESVVSAIKSVATVPVIAKPNAGMPTIDAQGKAHYSMGAEDFAAHMCRLVEKGARVVGGCCGTDPEYIRLLAQNLRKTKE